MYSPFFFLSQKSEYKKSGILHGGREKKRMWTKKKKELNKDSGKQIRRHGGKEAREQMNDEEKER